MNLFSCTGCKFRKNMHKNCEVHNAEHFLFRNFEINSQCLLHKKISRNCCNLTKICSLKACHRSVEFCIMVTRLKAKHQITNAAVTDWLQFLKVLHPDDDSMPDSWEKVQDTLQIWRARYRVIHVCTCLQHLYTGMKKKIIEKSM